PFEVTRARAELDGLRRVLQRGADDAEGALDLSGAERFARVLLRSVLFVAETLAELLADLEERKPEVVGAVRALFHHIGRADLPVVTCAGREVALERLRGGGGVAGVEIDECPLDRGRVPVERPTGVPATRPDRERRSHEREPERPTSHVPSASCEGLRR